MHRGFNKGQVWIENVLYTLIGLALIGLVLAFVMPRINEAKDKVVIEQTISSLNTLDEKIQMAEQSPGSRRKFDLMMKRGDFLINSSNDRLIFMISDVVAPYSEPGVQINIGKVKVLTEEASKNFAVVLVMDYNFNLTYMKEDNDKKFTAASVPYTFFVENLGNLNNNGKIVISLEESTGA